MNLNNSAKTAEFTINKTSSNLVKLKILLLTYRSSLGSSHKVPLWMYSNANLSFLSSISGSSQPFVPLARTAKVQFWAFSSICPLLWNDLQQCRSIERSRFKFQQGRNLGWDFCPTCNPSQFSYDEYTHHTLSVERWDKGEDWPHAHISIIFLIHKHSLL